MKNLYFKIFITFLFLICFSANTVFATQISKVKIALEVTKDNQNAEHNTNLEELLTALYFVSFQPKYIPNNKIGALQSPAYKFALPMSYYSIPDRPPKR